MKQFVFDTIWVVLMFIGITVGYMRNDITSGEFYLGLLLAMFVGRWMLRDDMNDKE